MCTGFGSRCCRSDFRQVQLLWPCVLRNDPDVLRNDPCVLRNAPGMLRNILDVLHNVSVEQFPGCVVQCPHYIAYSVHGVYGPWAA